MKNLLCLIGFHGKKKTIQFSTSSYTVCTRCAKTETKSDIDKFIKEHTLPAKE